jgi:hypothetical protein
MANEQTSVPLYAASEILTAANMNISAGTGVPVFATTVTRDAAFGGANEKALAEGQLCYLSATNVVQYYDGAAWATVGPAAASALTFLSAASFTTASTVSLATNTFSATYANYKLMFQVTAATANANLGFRYRVSGTDNSTTNYYSAGVGRTYAGSAATQDSGGADNQAYQFGVASPGTNFISMDIFGPQLTQVTSTNAVITANSSGAGLAAVYGTLFGLTTSFDSITFFPTSGTITGSYKVYAYANS